MKQNLCGVGTTGISVSGWDALKGTLLNHIENESLLLIERIYLVLLLWFLNKAMSCPM